MMMSNNHTRAVGNLLAHLDGKLSSYSHLYAHGCIIISEVLPTETDCLRAVRLRVYLLFLKETATCHLTRATIGQVTPQTSPSVRIRASY